MAQQKTNPKLEQALTRGDLAIRQANSGRATSATVSSSPTSARSAA